MVECRNPLDEDGLYLDPFLTSSIGELVDSSPEEDGTVIFICFRTAELQPSSLDNPMDQVPRSSHPWLAVQLDVMGVVLLSVSVVRRQH